MKAGGGKPSKKPFGVSSKSCCMVCQAVCFPGVVTHGSASRAEWLGVLVVSAMDVTCRNSTTRVTNLSEPFLALLQFPVLPALAAPQAGLTPICREKVLSSFSPRMELWQWMLTQEKGGSSPP